MPSDAANFAATSIGGNRSMNISGVLYHARHSTTITLDHHVSFRISKIEGKDYREYMDARAGPLLRHFRFLAKRKNRQCKELECHGEGYRSRNGSVVKQTHNCTACEPGNAETGVKDAKGGASLLGRNNGGQHCFEAGILRSNSDSPKGSSQRVPVMSHAGRLMADMEAFAARNDDLNLPDQVCCSS